MTDTIAPPTLTAEEVHAKMRQLRNARSRIAEEIATCDADRAKLQEELRMIDEHQERVTKEDREFCGMLERELSAHLLNLRATDDRVKSVRTPWGDVTSRVQQPEYKRDEHVLRTWMARTGWTTTREVVDFDWDLLKKESHVNANGQMVTNAGEVVPGVEVIERGPKVVVETFE
jgi:hypothetical protein